MQCINNPQAGELHDIIEADTLKDDDAAVRSPPTLPTPFMCEHARKDAARFVQERDFAELVNFHHHPSLVRKADRKRLIELGLVYDYGFGRFALTAFGGWILDALFAQGPSLPLKTGKERQKQEKYTPSMSAGSREEE